MQAEYNSPFLISIVFYFVRMPSVLHFLQPKSATQVSREGV